MPTLWETPQAEHRHNSLSSSAHRRDPIVGHNDDCDSFDRADAPALSVCARPPVACTHEEAGLAVYQLIHAETRFLHWEIFETQCYSAGGWVKLNDGDVVSMANRPGTQRHAWWPCTSRVPCSIMLLPTHAMIQKTRMFATCSEYGSCGTDVCATPFVLSLFCLGSTSFHFLRRLTHPDAHVHTRVHTCTLVLLYHKTGCGLWCQYRLVYTVGHIAS